MSGVEKGGAVSGRVQIISGRAHARWAQSGHSYTVQRHSYTSRESRPHKWPYAIVAVITIAVAQEFKQPFFSLAGDAGAHAERENLAARETPGLAAAAPAPTARPLFRPHPGRRALSLEVDRDGHDHRHGYAVQERRRVLPLTHGVQCGLIEQRDRAQDLRVDDLAVDLNHLASWRPGRRRGRERRCPTATRVSRSCAAFTMANGDRLRRSFPQPEPS